jgi:hypothetical protein
LLRYQIWVPVAVAVVVTAIHSHCPLAVVVVESKAEMPVLFIVAHHILQGVDTVVVEEAAAGYRLKVQTVVQEMEGLPSRLEQMGPMVLVQPEVGVEAMVAMVDFQMVIMATQDLMELQVQLQ